jgi:glyoxylase-like metal-dependent hydrolase (beta-lactamase superfamily II)
MQILTARGGFVATNSFLIADETTGKAVIFDAPDNTVGILIDRARQLQLDVIGLWLTHGHFDHIADHAVVTEAFPQAKVLLHKLDEPKLQRPNATFFALPFIIPPRSADAYVEDGQVLELGSLKARVIFTPGHSPGHVCYHFEEQGILVGGDLIIGGAIGRTDFPDCSEPDMIQSVRRVMRLPDETRLLPGHGDPSTIGYERETNEYVQAMIEADE